jgi:peptide/nickel transport system permease protein
MTATWLDRRRSRIDDLSGGRSLSSEAFRRLRREPAAIVGAIIIGVFVLVAVFAPLIAPHDAAQPFPELQQDLRPGHIPGPQEGFPLGSDQLGRDFYSRMILASQQTLLVGVFATLIGLAIGVVIGTVAGAFGGWVDTVLMRVTDVLLAIPSLLLAISVAALAANPSQTTVIIAVAIVGVPIFARLLRGTMLAQRHSDHVVAATALGVKRPAVVLRHMLPNAIGPVIVQATLTLATAIIEAAALSFLGLGNPDSTIPEWGVMLADAQPYLGTSKSYLLWFPGLAILVTVLAVNFVGDGLRDAVDPRGRGSGEGA